MEQRSKSHREREHDDERQSRRDDRRDDRGDHRDNYHRRRQPQSREEGNFRFYTNDKKAVRQWAIILKDRWRHTDYGLIKSTDGKVIYYVEYWN